MLPFVLAGNEMRRLWSRTSIRIAVVASLLVPLLYGAFYLYANWDPFSQLDKLPAALVVDSSIGESDDTGLAVARQLVDTGTFDWKRVDAAAAHDGVTTGAYAFALTLPGSFTSDEGANGEKTANDLLVLTTGDAGDYIDSVVANRVVEEVRTAVLAEVGSETANKLILGYDTIAQQTKKSAKTASGLAEDVTTLSQTAGDLSTTVADLTTAQQGLTDRTTGLDGSVTSAQDALDGLTSDASGVTGAVSTLAGRASGIPGQAGSVASGASSVVDSLATVDGIDPALGEISAAYEGLEPQIAALGLTTEQLTQVTLIFDNADGVVRPAIANIAARADTISNARGTASAVSDNARSLATTAGGLSGPAGDATRAASDLSDNAQSLATSFTALATATSSLATDQQTTQTSLTDLQKSIDGIAKDVAAASKSTQQLSDDLTEQSTNASGVDASGATAGSDAISSPLAVKSATSSGAGAYGVGLTPFLLGIATWIGAFVLFLFIRPLSTRALAARMPAWRVAFGGWLPTAMLGIVQVVVMLAVAVFGLGVRPAQPLALAGFLILTSLAFTATLHALNAAFGRGGLLLGLLLLIVQLATAGGSFPWQTLPDALKPLHVLLPMGYVVDGARALMYSNDLAITQEPFLVMGGYLVAGLILSTVAARWHQRWTPARLEPTLVV